MAFYLSAWSWIGDDETKLVQDFYRQGILHPNLNITYIALVPKKENAKTQDFRPISMCNVVYKIKILDSKSISQIISIKLNKLSFRVEEYPIILSLPKKLLILFNYPLRSIKLLC